ncbi:MAG: hypothetical protein K9L76_02815, partial [Candidatus Omnitrophica bacterium]|nr:hypothetical protein [Candidatus Omnitrophota bacterium]
MMRTDQIKNKDFSESGVFNETQKERFKPWMKVIACVVIFCFLYQDIVRAASPAPIFNYGPAVNPSAVLKINSEDFNRLSIPEVVRSTLLQVSGQNRPTQIQFPSGKALEVQDSSNLNPERINHIYNLLEKKPCGTQSLHDYLRLTGRPENKSDVSSIIFSIDLAQNQENFKAGLDTKPEDLESSLYAIEKSSQLLGESLQAVKLKPYLLGDKLNQITPFIAHLKQGHYILVKEVKDKKVYGISNSQEIVYSEKDFQEKFSGFAAVSTFLSLSNYTKLTDEQAKKIKGAEAHWSQASAVFDDNAAQVDDIVSDIKSASLKSLAISVGSSVVLGGIGWGSDAAVNSSFNVGKLSWTASNFNSVIGQLGNSVMLGGVMTGVTGIGETIGLDTKTTRIAGAAIGGAAFGGMGMGSFGSISGGLKGMTVGALSNTAGVLAYDSIAENFDNEWGQAFASVGSSLAGMYVQDFTTAGLGGYKTYDGNIDARRSYHVYLDGREGQAMNFEMYKTVRGQDTGWSDAFSVANQRFVANIPATTKDIVSSSIEVIGETQFDIKPVYSNAIGSALGSIGASYLDSRINAPIAGWNSMDKLDKENKLEELYSQTHADWKSFSDSKREDILDTAMAVYDPSPSSMVVGGIADGVLSLGTAYGEDWVGKNIDLGSISTPLTEAAITTAITGVVRGTADWAITKMPGYDNWNDTWKRAFALDSTYLTKEYRAGLQSDKEIAFETRKPSSLIGSIVNNTATSLRNAGLDSLTLGGYGYSQGKRNAYNYMAMQVGAQGVFMPQISPFEGIDSLQIIDGDLAHNIKLAKAFERTSGYKDYDYFNSDGSLNLNQLEEALEDYQSQDVGFQWQIVSGMHNLAHDIYHQESVSNLKGIIQSTPAFKYFGYSPTIALEAKLPYTIKEGKTDMIGGSYFASYHLSWTPGGVSWNSRSVNAPSFFEQAYSEGGIRRWGTKVNLGNDIIWSFSEQSVPVAALSAQRDNLSKRSSKIEAQIKELEGKGLQAAEGALADLNRKIKKIDNLLDNSQWGDSQKRVFSGWNMVYDTESATLVQSQTALEDPTILQSIYNSHSSAAFDAQGNILSDFEGNQFS